MISDLKKREDAWLQDRINELDAQSSLTESQIQERYEKLNNIKREMKEIEYELKARRNESIKQQREAIKKAEVKKQ